MRELTELRAALLALRDDFRVRAVSYPSSDFGRAADDLNALVAATAHLPASFVVVDPCDGTSPEGLRAQEDLESLTAECSRLREQVVHLETAADVGECDFCEQAEAELSRLRALLAQTEIELRRLNEDIDDALDGQYVSGEPSRARSVQVQRIALDRSRALLAQVTQERDDAMVAAGIVDDIRRWCSGELPLRIHVDAQGRETWMVKDDNPRNIWGFRLESKPADAEVAALSKRLNEHDPQTP